MLEDMEVGAVSSTIYRLANLSNYAKFGSQRGLSFEEVQDLLKFLSVGATDLLREPFKPKPLLHPSTPFGKPTRYSDGTWPVFYGALEQKTVESECLHHYARVALGSASSRSAYYSLLSCLFEGEAMDLRPKLEEWPDLISNDYGFCQELGREANAMPLASFLAPSARETGGTTSPIFSPDGLSDPEITGTVRFSVDASGGRVSVDRASN